jgi:hypothetical protein
MLYWPRSKPGAQNVARGETDTATALAPTFIPVSGVVPIGSSDPDPPEGIEAACVTCVNCGFMDDVRELMGQPRG